MYISCILSTLGAVLSYLYIDNKQLSTTTTDLPESGSFDDAIVSFISGGYRASREGSMGQLEGDKSSINYNSSSSSSLVYSSKSTGKEKEKERERERTSEIAMEGTNPLRQSGAETFAL